MAHLITARLNVKKIPLDKYVKGEKGTYVDITIGIADEPNDYNQTTSAWLSQSQEERQGKQPRTYVGNGIVLYSDEKPLPVFKKQQEEPKAQEPNKTDDDIDLPF